LLLLLLLLLFLKKKQEGETIVTMSDTFTEQQILVLAILPRIGATISLFSSLYIVITVLCSPHYRSRVYHRIMLGTALNIMLWSVPNLWGSAAVPEGTSSVGSWGKGTTASCSASGFLLQLGTYAVPSYYVVLSFYSFTAVCNNFQLEKYKWIERWIHVGVHIYPIASAIYLLTIDAFNFSGTQCWIASVPLGCGERSDEVCTQGPQDIGRVQWLFAGIPAMILVIVPTFMMIALYIEV
jgi:hypothetical protein